DDDSPLCTQEALSGDQKRDRLVHVRQNIVGEDGGSLAIARAHIGGGGGIEEFPEGLDACLSGQLSDVSRRFDAQRANSSIAKALQQAAVVAGDFDHKVLFSQIKAPHHGIGEAVVMHCDCFIGSSAIEV